MLDQMVLRSSIEFASETRGETSFPAPLAWRLDQHRAHFQSLMYRRTKNLPAVQLMLESRRVTVSRS